MIYQLSSWAEIVVTAVVVKVLAEAMMQKRS